MFRSLKRFALLNRPAPPFAPVTAQPDKRTGAHQRPASVLRPDLVDRTLADSFPASDPPAWTGGVARAGRVARASAVRAAGANGPERATARREERAIPVVVVSTPDTGLVGIREGVLAILGAIGLALAVPFAILLLGLPLALLVRVLVDAVALAFTLASGG